MIKANPIVHHNSFHDRLQRKYEGNGQEVDINLPGGHYLLHIWHSFCYKHHKTAASGTECEKHTVSHMKTPCTFSQSGGEILTAN